jgi:leucyl/phenylalanyl-tRNA---protein transferase
MDYKFSIEESLQPENMISLYARGAFPMADEYTKEINWYLPKTRTIIPLNDYNLPRSLRKFMEKTDIEIRYDFDFLPVVKACAEREQTWISDELIEAYLRLQKTGHIHTVEAWKKGKLVGGLYGVAYKGAFFGESMFSRVTQASKVALVNLIEHLKGKNFVLLDVQYMTEHLKMFGAKEISYEKYCSLLIEAYEKECWF